PMQSESPLPAQIGGNIDVHQRNSRMALLHLGFIVVCLVYSFKGHLGIKDVQGVTPYGASTIVGADGARMPSPLELEAAHYQGRHVAAIAEGCNRLRWSEPGLLAAGAVAAAAE